MTMTMIQLLSIIFVFLFLEMLEFILSQTEKQACTTYLLNFPHEKFRTNFKLMWTTKQLSI